MRCVLNAQKLIEWLLEEHDITSREEGVALGRAFIATGILRHGQPLSLSVTSWSVSVIHPMDVPPPLQPLMTRTSEIPTPTTASLPTTCLRDHCETHGEALRF